MVSKFQIPRSDSLEPDKPVVITEQQLRSVGVGFARCVREIGWKNLRGAQTDAALRNFHISIAAEPNDARAIIGRGFSRASKMLFQGALEDAEQVLSKNDVDKAAIYLKALCQYELGNFEEGLLIFNHGANKRGPRAEFLSGRSAIESTMENCIGRHAGPALTNLAPYVRKINRQAIRTQKELEQQKKICPDESDRKPLYHCKEDHWNRLLLRREERDKRIAQIYLNRMSECRQWCADQIAKNAPAPNEKSRNEILEMTKMAFDEVENRLNILRARKPLYHLSNRLEPCRELINKQEHRSNEIKLRIVLKELDRMFHNLSNQRRRKQLRNCVLQADRIKTFIDNIHPKILKEKTKFLKQLSDIMASVYLDRMQVCQHLSERANRSRVENWLGLNPEYNDIGMDPMVQSSALPFFNYKAWAETYKKHVKVARTKLELAWIHFELSNAYSGLKKWNHMTFEAVKSAACAKECGCVQWEIIALFQISVGECQKHDGVEARETLAQCIQAAKTMDNQHLLEFLTIAENILNRKTFAVIAIDTNAIICERENALLGLLKDTTTKEQVRDLLSRIRILPTYRRLNLIPGIKPTEKFKSNNKSIMPGGKGGKLGLHPITGKSYREFVEVYELQPSN